MTRTVQYNGVTHNFPDGTTDAQVRAALATYKPSAAQLALADAQARQRSAPQQVRAITNGATLGLANLVDAGGAAAETGFYNLTHPGQAKYGMADAFNAVRQESHDADTKFAREHPNQAMALGLLGGLAMPGSSLIGGAIDGIKIANPLLRIGAKTLASSAVGGGMGAINGAASAAPGQEAQGAVRDGVTGLVLGASAPAVTAIGGQVLKAGARAATTVARATNTAVGGGLFKPTKIAAQRLTEAMNEDGLKPAVQKQILNGWLTKGITPSIVDLAGPGSKTAALLRSAALNSTQARPIISNYADRVMGQVQRDAANAARQLTPGEMRPAPVVQNALKADRSAMAAKEYPSGVPVDTAPIVEQISGVPGGQAINSAKYTADVYNQADQLSQFGKLRKAANPGEPATLPPGTENFGPDAIAQIRQQLGLGYEPPPSMDISSLKNMSDAFNGMGADALTNAKTARNAPGLFDRAKAIDAHLSDVSPEYAIADQNFAQRSRNMDAIDVGGQGYALPTHDYTAQLEALSPPSGHYSITTPDLTGNGAQIGFRGKLVDQIRSQNPGDMGVLKTIGTNPDIADNLALTFGKDVADHFAGQGSVADNMRGQINLLRDRAATARSIDSAAGSRTALNAIDSADELQIPHLTHAGLFGDLIRRLNLAARSSPEEYAALARLGTSDAPDVLSTLQVNRSSPQRIQDYMDANGSKAAQRLFQTVMAGAVPVLPSQ